ncbi:MAG: septal ring lytic transglycosylase RlpA family protein [Alphaproteobacteria bacterium]|nr:septal ring lytic transglycosylase RlpA family protein [Alphaproteobacteria bacterium]
MRFFFLLPLLLLASCAGNRDITSGKYPVQGICRSCKPHMVRGSWYTPQLYYDYDETDTASWYGPRFHGKPGAAGQIFDQNGISAAHRTLPLPTIVKVTNLSNGKSINLVVNDRGPYTYDGRIIDLSMGAAKAIGVYAKGTAKVRVQAIPAQSQAFSLHLAKIGNRAGAVPGRTWEEVYNEDIAPNHSSEPYEKGSSNHHPVPGLASSHAHHHGGDLEVVPLKLPGKSPVKAAMNAIANGNPLDVLIAEHAALPLPKTIIVPNVATPLPTAPVAVRAQKAAKPMATGPLYYIQLASFVKKDNALKLLQEVDGLAQAAIQETVVPPGQTFYSVKCGPYPSEDAAQMALTSLDVLGHSPRLIKE